MSDRHPQPDSPWPSWDPDAGPERPGGDPGGLQDQDRDQPTMHLPALPREGPSVEPPEPDPPVATENSIGNSSGDSAGNSAGTTIETRAVPQPWTPGRGSGHVPGQPGHTQQHEVDRLPDQHGVAPAETVPPAFGTGPDPPDETKPSLWRRRRGPLLIAIVLVVCMAAGGVLALPAVSNRLALPWAPNAPESEPPDPLSISRDLHGPSDSAPEPTPSGVAAALDDLVSDPGLGTLTGSVVDPVTDETLWEQDGDRGRVPASTTKLLTAGAALLALDHDMRLPTTVVEGEQPGTVVLVPGGDVTLSSLPPDQEGAYSGAASLDSLVDQVEQETEGDVRQVQVDSSLFTGANTAPGWEPEDAPSTFAAPVEPAMLDGGRSVPDDPKSERVGDPVDTLAQEFAERLGAEMGPPLDTPPADGDRTLGEVESAPLTDLIEDMLLDSDNVLADALARQVALAEGTSPSFEGAAEATLDVLAQHDFDVDDTTLVDGSGLSPRNEISAGTLTEFLSVVAEPDANDPRVSDLRPMVTGLPVAAGSGTLAERYDDGPAHQGRGWVRAKTGTHDEAHTLAGLVLDSDDRLLVFALMSSGDDSESARAALDDMAAALRSCGCR